MLSQWFIETDNGFQLSVKVSPGSKRTRLLSADPKAPWIKVALSAPPEKGKANQELLSFLSDLFQLPERNCSILSGQTSSKKRVFIGKKLTYNECCHILKEV